MDYQGSSGTQGQFNKEDSCLENTNLISTLPAGSYAAQISKWHTRGWAFQEGILSTRRLILAEAQVLFECNGMHCSKVLHLPLSSMHTPEKQKFDNLAYMFGVFSARTPGSDPLEYMQYVSSYSSRELIYHKDILDAFQGVVLNAFKGEKRPEYHFWGIPIFLTDHSLLRTSGKKRFNQVNVSVLRYQSLLALRFQFSNLSKLSALFFRPLTPSCSL